MDAGIPFYVYSVAYGSVPIFIPQLYPHSFYNSRYGMEMLPGLVLFAFIAVAALELCDFGKTKASAGEAAAEDWAWRWRR